MSYAFVEWLTGVEQARIAIAIATAFEGEDDDDDDEDMARASAFIYKRFGSMASFDAFFMVPDSGVLSGCFVLFAE